MRIGLLDHMGYGNLGDAATQEALIANIRLRLPHAQILGFSLNPGDTEKRHGIPSYSITNWHPGLDNSGPATSQRSGFRLRLKAILKNIPIFSRVALWGLNLLREAAHLGRSFKTLRTLDILIIAGGGQLGELWRGPWSHPYNVFKFSVLTKLANRRLLFINVGAGPLDSSLGKAFVRYSVNLANYVSFRDAESQALVHRLGVKSETYVFPDSAYALDIARYKANNFPRASRPIVGINPIGFCDPRIWPQKDDSVYMGYLDKLTEFLTWLVDRDYQLKVYSAEASVDIYALEDLQEKLTHSLASRDTREMFIPPSDNVNDLLLEMSRCNFVVTSKFHGVVFSHLLEKPVLALSYQNKIDDLMRTVGHSQYCLSIETFDVEGLKRAFATLVENAEEVKCTNRQIRTRYSVALKGQFDAVFALEDLRLQCDFSRS